MDVNPTATTADVADPQLAELSADELRERLESTQRALEDYRTRVRDRAIKAFHDNEWNLDGLNDTLERLDLPPYEPKYVTQADTTIRFQLQADVPDTYDGEERMRMLGTSTVRDDIRQALTEILTKHAPEGLSLTDRDIRVSIDYATQVMA